MTNTLTVISRRSLPALVLLCLVTGCSMISSHEIYETAENCSIPFDTPVNSDNADTWREHNECIKDLIDKCGTAFSHVDDDRNWITDCMDPRDQIDKEDRDLVEDLMELSAAYFDDSGGSVLL